MLDVGGLRSVKSISLASNLWPLISVLRMAHRPRLLPCFKEATRSTLGTLNAYGFFGANDYLKRVLLAAFSKSLT